MATATVTKLLAYAEADGDGSEQVTKLIVYAEADVTPAAQLDMTQVVVYAEAEAVPTAKATQVLAYADANTVGGAIAATAFNVEVEARGTDLKATQFGVDLELDGVDLRATQFGVIIEFDERPPYARQIEGMVLVDWDRDGTYTDETSNFVTARGRHAIVAPEQSITGGSGITDQCTVVLHNLAHRYSPGNDNSPIWAYTRDGGFYQLPIIVQVREDGGAWVRLFTGYIRQADEAQEAPGVAATVTLDCRSRDDLLLQLKADSTQAELNQTADGGFTEEWHIIRWLEKAGLEDGTDFRSQDWVADNGGTRTVDYGLFPIDWSWLADESPLADLWRLAGAALGWFYADPDGVFRYRNAAGLLPAMDAAQHGAGDPIELHQANTATMTLWHEDRELYNEVTVQYAPRAPGETETLWEPDRPPVIPPGQTVEVWANLSYPATTVTVSGWTAHNAGGTQVAGVSLAVTYYAQRVKLAFTNASTQQVYVYGLSLTGRFLRSDEPEEITKTSTAGFWTDAPGRTGRGRKVSGNEYIQSTAHADTVATFLRDRHEAARRFIRITGVDNPHVRCGTRVQVGALVIFDNAVPGVVTETSWQLNSNGLKLDATVMDTADLFENDAYFVIGTNTLGDGTLSGNLPIFY